MAAMSRTRKTMDEKLKVMMREWNCDLVAFEKKMAEKIDVLGRRLTEAREEQERQWRCIFNSQDGLKDAAAETNKSVARIKQLEACQAHGPCWPWRHAWGRWTFKESVKTGYWEGGYSVRELLTRRCEKCGKVQERLV